MATYLFSLLLEEQGFGWTEDYHVQADTIADAVDLPLGLRRKAMAFRASTVSLIGTRASNVLVPFDADERKYTSEILGGRLISGLNDSYQDLHNASAQIRMKAANNHRGIHHCRGLLDEDVRLDRNGNPNPPAGFLQPLTAWTDLLAGLGGQRNKIFGMYVPDRPPALNARQTISSIGANTNPNWTDIVTTVALAGAAVNGPISINRVPRNEIVGINGVYKIVAMDAGTRTYTIPYRYRYITPIFRPARATATVPTFAFQAFFDGDFWRYSTRKTGRPIERSAGRARGAIRRQ